MRITPSILLVEDDPTSRAFLAAAVRAIPAEVDGADSLAAALALARSRRYELWLFDANLPDGDGRALLAQARGEQPDVPALAHTASNDPAIRDALLAAGFREVLVKPLPAAAVQAAVRRTLGLDTPATATGSAGAETRPLWDDDAAASALNGNREHVATLRELFVAELPQTRERVLASARTSDREATRAELHKLRASCGFVGAARMAEAVQALQLQPDAADALERFDRAAVATLARAEAVVATGPDYGNLE